MNFKREERQLSIDRKKHKIKQDIEKFEMLHNSIKQYRTFNLIIINMITDYYDLTYESKL